MAINSNIPMKLHEFNNLTKSLNFYFYDISYAGDKEDKLAYNKYINDKYNAEKLSAILKTVTEKIGASVLNLSKQNYDPVGSSVCLLITEEPVAKEIIDFTNNEGNVDLTHIEHVSHPTPIQEEDLFAHLDKSHITVHTYPEYSPITNLATFRVDINVSTCGKISPLVALNYLIDEFEIEDVTEVVCIDYLVRGFTRLTSDEKIFIDHKINNITDFIDKEYLDKYHFKNVNYKKNRI
jgi:S-adenosylmethionine decarboxylase